MCQIESRLRLERSPSLAGLEPGTARSAGQYLSSVLSYWGSSTLRPGFKSQSDFVVVVALLFYVHGKHLRSCRDGQLT